MTQDDLKMWLEHPDQDCYVFKAKEKEDGIYYFMRQNGFDEIAILFPPRSGVYKKEHVCHICNTLKVAVPNWAQGAQALLDGVKKYMQERAALIEGNDQLNLLQ